MKIVAATCAGVLLFAASFVLLWAADEPMDVMAIAGGTGIVVSGALLGLTLLAWRWRTAGGAFVSTVVDPTGFYEELAAFDDSDQRDYLDAAAI